MFRRLHAGVHTRDAGSHLEQEQNTQIRVPDSRELSPDARAPLRFSAAFPRAPAVETCFGCGDRSQPRRKERKFKSLHQVLYELVRASFLVLSRPPAGTARRRLFSALDALSLLRRPAYSGVTRGVSTLLPQLEGGRSRTSCNSMSAVPSPYSLTR